MTATREPGFYWVRTKYHPDPFVAEWYVCKGGEAFDNPSWLLPGSEVPEPDGYCQVVSERLVPPA